MDLICTQGGGGRGEKEIGRAFPSTHGFEALYHLVLGEGYYLADSDILLFFKPKILVVSF